VSRFAQVVQKHTLGEVRTCTVVWWPVVPRIGRAKTVQNSARFRTTSDFDPEYLRNASKHPEAENGVINYGISHVDKKW